MPIRVEYSSHPFPRAELRTYMYVNVYTREVGGTSVFSLCRLGVAKKHLFPIKMCSISCTDM